MKNLRRISRYCLIKEYGTHICTHLQRIMYERVDTATKKFLELARFGISLYIHNAEIRRELYDEEEWAHFLEFQSRVGGRTVYWNHKVTRTFLPGRTQRKNPFRFERTRKKEIRRRKSKTKKKKSKGKRKGEHKGTGIDLSFG